MLFTIVVIVLIVACLVGTYFLDKHGHNFAVGPCCGLSIVLFAILLGSLILIPSSRSGDRHKVIEATAMQQTIDDFRANGDDLERTGLIDKALDFNVWLAQTQSDYKRNDLWWGWWRDYSIMQIKPIK